MIGTVIEYCKERTASYELTYHYLFDRLIFISQKTPKNNRKYNFVQIFMAKMESLLFFDKMLYYGYKKDDLILVNLFNKMLIY